MPTLIRFVCAYLVLNLHYFLSFEESARNYTAVAVVLVFLNIFLMMASIGAGILMRRTPFDRMILPWLCNRRPGGGRRAPPNGIHQGSLIHGDLLDGMMAGHRRVLLQYLTHGERIVLQEHTSLRVLMRHTRLRITQYSLAMLILSMIPALVLSLTSEDASNIFRVGIAIMALYLIMAWILQIAPSIGWLTITGNVSVWLYWSAR
jgi:uncharacterized membrane protein